MEEEFCLYLERAYCGKGKKKGEVGRFFEENNFCFSTSFLCYLETFSFFSFFKGTADFLFFISLALFKFLCAKRLCVCGGGTRSGNCAAFKLV